MSQEAPNVDVFSKRRSRAAIISLAGALLLMLILTFIGEALTPGAANQRPGHNSWSYGAQGFRALYDVLEALGYQVERHRRTYRGLPPGEDSVLLSLDPGTLRALFPQHSTPAESEDEGLLREWVEAGGRLIVTRSTHWMFRYGGFEITVLPEDDAGEDDLDGDDSTGDTTQVDAVPFLSRVEHQVLDRLLEDVPDVVPHPLRETVRTLRPLEEFTAALPDLTPGQTRALGVYLSSGDGMSIDLFVGAPADAITLVSIGDGALALEYEIGEGRLVCLSTAFPFSNGALKWTPAAEVVTHLIRYVSQGGRRRIYFDELTHGFYQKSGLLRWVRETALFYPLMTALVGILIAGWYGAVRFGPPRPDRESPRRAKEEFVLSLGDMYRRGQHYEHTLALIVEAYEMRLARISHLQGATYSAAAGGSETRFSYHVPETEREFLKVAISLHEEYLTLVNTLRGKKTPRDE